MNKRDEKAVRILKEYLAECASSTFDDHKMNWIMVTFLFGRDGLPEEGAMIRKAIRAGAMEYVNENYSANRGKMLALLSESEELTPEETGRILRWLDLAMDHEVGVPEEADEDKIRLLTANGEEVEFTEIAGIAVNGRFYVILQPVILLDGMNDDEALVFEVSRGAEGDRFEIVLDDEIIDVVFDAYNKLLDEAEN